MSECANCHVSVYVPDGYEFEEGDLCMSCTKAKADWLLALVDSADEPNGSMMWTSDHDKILARQEEQWKTWGVVEIAVRNPSVSEYMSHWEGRTTKAEESLSRKEYYDSMRSREIDMAQIPESQKRFVSALLNQRDDSYRKMEEAKQENDKLRGLLAQGKGDCVYCGLPAADISKCPHGFPGCSRMDDIVNAPETPKDEEIIRLRFLLSKLRDFTVQFVRIEMTNGKLYEMLAEELDGRKPEPTL
jgi:hypothetical protein